MAAAQITQDIQMMEQIAVAMMERTRPATAFAFLIAAVAHKRCFKEQRAHGIYA